MIGLISIATDHGIEVKLQYNALKQKWVGGVSSTSYTQSIELDYLETAALLTWLSHPTGLISFNDPIRTSLSDAIKRYGWDSTMIEHSPISC